MRFIALVLGLAALSFSAAPHDAFAAGPTPQTMPASSWQVGTPIVTYFAGPPLNEAVVKQMAEGGFNVVWCAEKDLDLLKKYGLRGMLRDDLLNPVTTETPEHRQKLDALIERVRAHPALYSYFITDEPPADAFPRLGDLVAHLKQRDPAHFAYINLFPTYATNKQLGTNGDAVTAYRDYLGRFISFVKPPLLSYDNYVFYKADDKTGYFQNLDLVRRASQESGLPFLNIIQAAAWESSVRVPTADETRYLVYTTAAYGAQGVSYYVYSAPGHEGGIAAADGTPTPIYATLKTLNPEFVAVATELQHLRSLAVYHTVLREEGCVALPAEALFHPASAPAKGDSRGLLLGCFGNPRGSGEVAATPTHVVVVNLNYKAASRTTLVGPGNLEVFDPTTKKWAKVNADHVDLQPPPGGGKLVRVGP